MFVLSEVIKSIDVSNLTLYPDNPRYDDIAENQRDAILKIVEEQQEKLIKLATEIVDYGFSYIDMVAVTRDEKNNTYVVREGNRRIAALKLLMQPNIIDGKKGICEKFKQLNKRFSLNPITTINCVIFDNESLLNRRIEIKHTGENSGIGVVAWNTIQKRRFDESLGKHNVVSKIINFILNCEQINNSIKENIYKLAITNFERLLGDPFVRDEMGISITGNDEVSINVSDNKFSIFVSVVTDMIFNEKFTVNQIYYKEDRRKYINAIKDLTNKTNKGAAAHNGDIPQTLQSVDDNGVSSSPKISSLGGQAFTIKEPKIPQDYNGNLKPPIIKRQPLSTSRKYLIPANCKINIAQPRLNKIYHELSSLEVSDYTNAVAVLFRTFIELSVDEYGSKKIKGYSDGLRLTDKVRKVTEYMKTNSILADNEIKPIEMLSNVPQDKKSINTFNAYVHNHDVNPISDDLKIAWDNITYFIIKLFETL